MYSTRGMVATSQPSAVLARDGARGFALFGRGQIIVRDEHTRVCSGGSDLRGDGLALGLL